MIPTKKEYNPVWRKLCPRCGNTMIARKHEMGETLVCEIEHCGYTIDTPYGNYTAPIQKAEVRADEK